MTPELLVIAILAIIVGGSWAAAWFALFAWRAIKAVSTAWLLDNEENVDEHWLNRQ